jgi:hypothetical protein
MMDNQHEIEAWTSCMDRQHGQAASGDGHAAWASRVDRQHRHAWAWRMNEQHLTHSIEI